jgi:hypothetical protein
VWRAIADRIRGLADSAQSYRSVPQSSFGGVRNLRPNIEGVLADLATFRNQLQQALPPRAVAVIDDATKSVRELLTMATGQVTTAELSSEAVSNALIRLSTFATEMTGILSNIQWPLRSLAERAFQHLQRLIVVDDAHREKWKTAFGDGEVECERLGAVHLLWHGIWAFKVDAQGGRTDLVFQEPSGDLSKEQQYVEGFVLTEWKIANSAEEALAKCREAREQTKLYSSGVLGGTELTEYRFVVIVSRQEIKLPDPIRDGGIEYRHINIVVEPSTPSRVARVVSRRSPS